MVSRIVLLTLLAACGQAEDPSTPSPEPTPGPMAVDYDAMSAARILSRASLDLRGVRPTDDELAQVEEDPAQLDVLLDNYLADDRLEEQVQELFTDVFLTRTDAYLINTFSFPIHQQEQDRLQRESGEEPVRIVARVVAEDRPIDEIVTADWTLSNELLAKVFPVDRDDGRGWQEARYTDGRPAAGVLSTNGMWWRYDSTFSNANRKRANAVSRILLCDDYLTRPVNFDRTVNVLDEEAIENSLRDNEACASCHDSLDPLASYFYGFSWYAYGGDEVTLYHPSRELGWVARTGMAPAYQGVPGSNLEDLGASIAEDPRFEMCMVRRVAEGLLGRGVDPDHLTPHREALRDAGGTLRPAMRSVVDSPAYRAATDDGVDGGAMPAKLAAPALMASQVEELTGFRWTNYGANDLLTSDLLGYLTLAGGADGYSVSERADRPTPTVLLVHERLAEAAASHTVRTFAEGGGVRWMDRLDLDWRPETDRSAMEEALTTAQRRALGHAESTGELLALWETLHALDNDPELAWIGVLSAILRDPDALLY